VPAPIRHGLLRTRRLWLSRPRRLLVSVPLLTAGFGATKTEWFLLLDIIVIVKPVSSRLPVDQRYSHAALMAMQVQVWSLIACGVVSTASQPGR
jgi:hypothetical protein